MAHSKPKRYLGSNILEPHEQRYRLLVYGYIREHTDHASMRIPTELVETIYLYIKYGHQMVTSLLTKWFPQRPQKEELESRNVVPPRYFEDPITSTMLKSLVNEMISSYLERFLAEERPSLDELQMRNIIRIHSDFCNNDCEHALCLKQQRAEERKETLNYKLNHNHRPTITDLGDMHIIPHDYLDNLLEDAVTCHTRGCGMDQVQEHLPGPVAAALADILVPSVPEDIDVNEEGSHLQTEQK
eukprot:100305_1